MKEVLSRYVLTESAWAQMERRATVLRFASHDISGQVSELQNAMQWVFKCDEPSKKVIRAIITAGQGHAGIHYARPQQVLHDVYSDKPWGDALVPAMVLTGLAGGGKSACLRAVARYLQHEPQSLALPGHQGLTHVPAWFLSLRDSSTLNSMLVPHISICKKNNTGPELEGREFAARFRTDEVPEIAPKSEKSIALDKLFVLARRASRRDGTCLTILDEMQFGSFSTTANAKVTSMLLSLLSLGPQLVFCCNYSLLHRLNERRQEDRQRLIANPIVLDPLAAESECFSSLIAEYCSIRPSDFALDPVKDAQILHRYTFGIKRALIQLLCTAWKIAKASKAKVKQVGPDEIARAYRAPEYAAYRTDVEALARRTMGEKKIRKDLVNPLEDVEDFYTNVLRAEPAIEGFRQRAADAHIYDSMTPNERAAEAALRKKYARTPKKSAEIVQLQSKQPSTKESLLAALDAFE